MTKIQIRYILVFSFLLATLLSGSSPIIKSSESKSYDKFSLSDYNNKLYSLEDFTNKRAIVIMFVSTNCPVSNAYNGRMAQIEKDLGDEFAFVGINSNKNENIAEIKQHAADNNLKFVILKDSNNVVADKFEASFTPEVYVLNNDLELLYHGRIDDSRKIENVSVSDLRNVLNEIKMGKKISVTETKAFGCSIKRVSK